jgi:hypothetical protein
MLADNLLKGAMSGMAFGAMGGKAFGLSPLPEDDDFGAISLQTKITQRREEFAEQRTDSGSNGLFDDSSDSDAWSEDGWSD